MRHSYPLINDPSVQFGLLHNRKTGGTALIDFINQQRERTPSMNVHCFGHAMTFPRFIKAYPHLKAIFFVREPISKFISGFYSRLRQGQPRYHFPWTKAEAKAFLRFPTPNALGEALSSKNLLLRYLAIRAMRSIHHIRHTLLDFLGDISLLEREMKRIAFIGHQSEFEQDIQTLRQLFHVDPDITISQDDVKTHRNPNHLDTYLSDCAIQNLSRWYQKDIELYHWCLMQKQKMFKTSTIPVDIQNAWYRKNTSDHPKKSLLFQKS